MDDPAQKTHVMYPLRFMVVTGNLPTGFRFYGMFDTHSEAQNWVDKNLRSELLASIHSIRKVREG
jgi:hypothetical protein